MITKKHTNISLSNVTGVVFDLDNTLVSSSLNFAEIKTSVGCPINQDILSFVEQLPLNLKLIANKNISHYEMKDATTAKKMQGVDDVLTLLNQLNIPCAIVTRNNQKSARLKLSNNDIVVPILLTREQFNSKPAPDSLQYLSDYWEMPPEQILCVGDYVYDIEMANNANTQSCLITYGKALDYEGLATFTVENLLDLTDLFAQANNA